jgi:6-phosphogluconolactonase
LTSHMTSPDIRVCRVTGASLTGTSSATAPGVAPVIAFDPAGRFFFAAAAGTVAAFRLDAAGNVSQPSSGASLPAGPKPKAICVDPSGRYLYVGNSGLPYGGDAVRAFAIDPATGGLTALATRSLSPGNDGVLTLAMDPLGRFLYAGTYGLGPTSLIHLLAIGADGALADLGTTPGAPFPAAGDKLLSVDPSGRFLLLSNGLNPELTTFAIDPSTGGLTRSGSALPAPGSPTDSTTPMPTALVVTGTVR